MCVYIISANLGSNFQFYIPLRTNDRDVLRLRTLCVQVRQLWRNTAGAQHRRRRERTARLACLLGQNRDLRHGARLLLP